MNSSSKNQNKIHNYFYKIVSLIDGGYYYGIHSTNNLNDGYFAGGNRITNALKKYGRKNFVREIIADYPTRKEASDHEKSIVTEELVADRNCYNLRTGGDNEFIIKFNDACREERSKMYTGENNPFYGKTHTDETKQKLSIASSGNKNRLGAVLSNETKMRLSIAHTQYQNSKTKIQLPVGVYYISDVVTDQQCYRFCPNCKCQITHTSRSYAIHSNNSKRWCLKCRANDNKKTVWLMNTDTHEINTKREFRCKLDISECIINKMIDAGKFVIYQKCNDD